MKLKIKIAKLLKSWADKLNPYYRFDNDMGMVQFKSS